MKTIKVYLVHILEISHYYSIASMTFGLWKSSSLEEAEGRSTGIVPKWRWFGSEKQHLEEYQKYIKLNVHNEKTSIN